MRGAGRIGSDSGLYGLAVVCGLIAMLGFSAGSDDLTLILWSLATTLCGFVFAFFWDRSFDVFSPAFFLGLHFAVTYGIAGIVPLIYMPSAGGFRTLLEGVLDVFPSVSVSSFFCLAALFMGFGRRKRNSTMVFAMKGAGGDEKVFCFLALGLGVAGFAIKIASGVFWQTTTELESSLFYSGIGILEAFFWIGVVFAGCKARISGQWIWRAVYTSALVVALVMGLLSGSKTLTLLPAILFVFVLNYTGSSVTRRKAAVGFCGLMVVLGLLLPFNALYRESMLASGGAGSVAGAGSLASGAADSLLSMETDSVLESSGDFGSQRLSNISMTAVIAKHSTLDKLQWGETYIRVLWAVVPRPIYMEKPPLTTGREVGVILGLAQATSIEYGRPMSATSVGLTLMGEAVYNFSLFGAPFGLLFVGRLYRYLYDNVMVGVNTRSPLAIAIWFELWFSGLLMCEGNFAGIWAGLVKISILALVTARVVGFTTAKTTPELRTGCNTMGAMSYLRLGR